MCSVISQGQKLSNLHKNGKYGKEIGEIINKTFTSASDIPKSRHLLHYWTQKANQIQNTQIFWNQNIHLYDCNLCFKDMSQGKRIV